MVLQGLSNSWKNSISGWGQSFSPRNRAPGLSLIEVGIAMLITSVALVPIVASSGGKSDSPNNATVVEAARDQSRSVVAANTLMERAMSGQLTINGYTGFGTFDPDSLGPGESYTSPIWQYDVNGDIWYQWVLQDVSYRQNDQDEFVDTWGNVVGAGEVEKARIAPKSNRVFSATLRLYPNQNSGVPSLVMPTFVFQQTGDVDSPTVDKTGIVMVLDRSGSMAATGNRGWRRAGGVASPFLRDRYFRNGLAANKRLDMEDNTQLDVLRMGLTNSPADDDPDTDYDDRFPSEKTGGGWDILDNTGTSDPDFNTFFTTNNGYNRTTIDRIWADRNNQNQADNALNRNVSRMEASRMAMLMFLTSLEQNQFLMSNIALGFVTYASNVTTETDMEDPENPAMCRSNFVGICSYDNPANNNETELRFYGNRERYLMINRWTNNGAFPTIPPSGGTHIDYGLSRADDILNPGAPKVGRCRQHQDSNPYQKKIIILLSDGQPNPNSGNNNRNGLTNMASCLGNNETTVYTIGVVGDDQTTMSQIATATPNGQYYRANNASELGIIFENIAYQIERSVLLNISDRYNLNLE